MPTVNAPNYVPHEQVIFHTPVGLQSLGAKFDIEAPFAACRLCGVVYQSPLDSKAIDYVRSGYLYEVGGNYFGHSVALNTLNEANEKRQRWRRLHERRYHTDKEITAFAETGYAFTPEAAHRLAPYGIVPTGNMSEEIVDAMFTAPRAPYDDAEGSNGS